MELNQENLEALKEQLTINDYVWKGEKHKNGQGVFEQNEFKLVDCTKEQLQQFYNHCFVMLNNKDKKNPGRYILLEIIKDQILRCNTELFLRYIEITGNLTRFNFLNSIRTLLDNNKGIDINELTNSDVTSGCPDEFKNIPLTLIMDGTLDKLGKFNRDHITLNFILKQGLWLTNNESKEFEELAKSKNMKDKLVFIKERLNLSPTSEIKLSPRGLSFSQLRACINLKSKKYSELTTDQLLILRNRILFSLEDLVRIHIKNWMDRAKQIEEVAKFKNIELTILND